MSYYLCIVNVNWQVCHVSNGVSVLYCNCDSVRQTNLANYTTPNLHAHMLLQPASFNNNNIYIYIYSTFNLFWTSSFSILYHALNLFIFIFLLYILKSGYLVETKYIQQFINTNKILQINDMSCCWWMWNRMLQLQQHIQKAYCFLGWY